MSLQPQPKNPPSGGEMAHRAKTKELLRTISELESVNDQLHAEIRYLDEMLRKVGFEKGITDLKRAAHECLEDEDLTDPPEGPSTPRE